VKSFDSKPGVAADLDAPPMVRSEQFMHGYYDRYRVEMNTAVWRLLKDLTSTALDRFGGDADEELAALYEALVALND
jgi:hypothetical protein